ncbi:MAG: ABC transporter ATP-binding protein, partial [Aeromicrobium sp.]
RGAGGTWQSCVESTYEKSWGRMVVASLTEVSKEFTVGQEAVVALDGVSLSVAPGELACIYGASGSGKSTMLNVLAGIDVADSGEVSVLGHSLTSSSESQRAQLRLRSIGVVFQSNNLLPEFTARENVELPLMVRGMSRAARHEAASNALAAVGLTALADRSPGHMSGGQRQRVGIARALAGEQPLLLADEPTGALDSTNSRQLFALMRDMCRAQETAVVLATHDPLAQQFADSVYLMVDGTVTAQ